MLFKNISRFFVLSSIVALTACGGGGSDSGGGDAEITDFITVRLIQFTIRDENFQPNQAQIDCVKTIPSDDPARDSKIQRCVDDNA